MNKIAIFAQLSALIIWHTLYLLFNIVTAEFRWWISHEVKQNGLLMAKANSCGENLLTQFVVDTDA